MDRDYIIMYRSVYANGRICYRYLPKLVSLMGDVNIIKNSKGIFDSIYYCMLIDH